MLDLADEIAQTSPKPRAGQWDFTKDDPEMARQYHTWITEEGWPEEIRGAPVSFGGVTFDPDR